MSHHINELVVVNLPVAVLVAGRNHIVKFLRVHFILLS